MTRVFLIFLVTVLLLPASAVAVEHTGLERKSIDLSAEAVERGRTVYMNYCVTCHGLEYFRDKEHPDGIPPALDAESARSAFGVEPPDLSLMAMARGKGIEGVVYIYRLLTTYYRTSEGEVRNRAIAELTESEGVIAMPQPIPPEDPELEEKAMDVAVFLLHVAQPEAGERTRLGRFVLGYMVVFTVLLFVLNRLTWKGVKKKLNL